jgi:hypothetical protein
MSTEQHLDDGHYGDDNHPSDEAKHEIDDQVIKIGCDVHEVGHDAFSLFARCIL